MTLDCYKPENAFSDMAIRKGTRVLRGSYDIIPIEPVEVGHRRQLLMDFHVVEDLHNCRRKVHEPVKHPNNPLITHEDFESGARPYGGTILRDPETGRLRMWLAVGAYRAGREAVSSCCCESTDGLVWRSAERKGGAETGSSKFLDATLTKAHNVVLLPERMRDRGRYGASYMNYLPAEEISDPETMHHMRYFTAFSEDGIEWVDVPENPVWVGRSDSTNSMVYNADRDVFMMYRRSTISAGEIRRVTYTESQDLISWSQPVTVITRDEMDPQWFYSMPVSYYHGVYLGFVRRLDYDEHEGCVLDNGKDMKMETELAWSRDGVQWNRHPQRPVFLPVSRAHNGACDWGFAMCFSDIIERDDDLLIYYEGRAHLHSPGYRDDEDPLRSHICLATLRRDGFVSVGADSDGGFMLTRPLAYPGGRLHINAKIASGGQIRVAVREGRGVRDGEWSDDFRFEKSVPFSGNSLDHIMAWTEDKPLDSFPDQIMRLHFAMENAELYSFWFE